MSRLKTMLAGAVFAACGLAGTAFASPGYTTTSVTMRAGPGGDFPPVVYLRRGTPTEVYGCLDEFTWCDVDADGQRGWVRGSKLDIAYQGRRVLLPYYGPRIGLPIVTFSFNDYWGRYYSDRPFFADRERWGRLPELRVPGFRGPDFRAPGYREPDDRDRGAPDYRPGGPELRRPDERPDARIDGDRDTDRGGYSGRPSGLPAGGGRPDGGSADRRPDRSGYQPPIPAPDQGRPTRGSDYQGAGGQHTPAPMAPQDRHPTPQAAPPAAHPAPAPGANPDRNDKKHDQPGG